MLMSAGLQYEIADAEEYEQRKSPISRHTITTEDCIQYAGIYAWSVHIIPTLYNAQHNEAARASLKRLASQQHVC